MGDLYKENKMYDSTLYAIYRANKIFKALGYYEEEANLLEKTGDLFFHAGLYDQAKYYYEKVQSIKGDKKAWTDWRKFVITNNLGLIYYEKEEIDKAYDFFLTALNNMISERKLVLNRDDSVRMAYSYTLLADVCIKKKNYEQARYFNNQLSALNSSLKQKNYSKDLNFSLGRIFFYEAKYDSAIYYLNKVKDVDPQDDYSDSPIEVDKYLSEIYEIKNDFKKALIARNTFYAKMDSLRKNQNTMAGILLLVDNKLIEADEKLSLLKSRQNIFLLIILLTILSLLTISFFYIKYRHTTKKLFKNALKTAIYEESKLLASQINTLQDVKNNISTNKENSEKNNDQRNGQSNLMIENENVEKLSNLILAVEDAMNKENLYLDPNISLESLASRLNTNRTILSKAINNHYKINFNEFINDFRIKKAISIMSKKDNLSLYKLETIATKVGFSNRTTFISAFKNYTGMTPSAFVKGIKNINENTL